MAHSRLGVERHERASCSLFGRDSHGELWTKYASLVIVMARYKGTRAMLGPTVARRAHLASKLGDRVDEASSRLQIAQAYHRSVTSQLELNDVQERFHLSSQVVDA